MNASERMPDHDGWCATLTYTAGTCGCHRATIVSLLAENEALEAKVERLKRIVANHFDVLTEAAIAALAAGEKP